MTADPPGDPAAPPIARIARISRIRRDVASAYLASASKITGWVIVSAFAYRMIGPLAFALLALVRGTVGLLNYVSLGLAPALIHFGARAETSVATEPTVDHVPDGILPYRTPGHRRDALGRIYSNALFLTYAGGLVGIILANLYSSVFSNLYAIQPPVAGHMPGVVLDMGVGTLLRLMGDAPGGVLQVRSRIAFDNLLVTIGEALWPILSWVAVATTQSPLRRLDGIAGAYCLTGILSFVLRLRAAGHMTGIAIPRLNVLNGAVLGQLLTFGIAIVLAQLADYLYAPTDYILIDRLLGHVEIANYAPAVQIDAGLLLLVTGLSTVMLPKAAIAHGSGDTKTVRQYYLLGTFASFLLLLVASTVVLVLSPWIFRVWLGNRMPVTQTILPIVLLNTVIGGSSAVGRSILLAIGRVRPFTISVLIAGVTNVLCSYAFVRFFHWGLRGIVLGTVVAVVGRCLIWMPWYVLRTLQTAPMPAIDSETLHTL